MAIAVCLDMLSDRRGQFLEWSAWGGTQGGSDPWNSEAPPSLRRLGFGSQLLASSVIRGRGDTIEVTTRWWYTVADRVVGLDTPPSWSSGQPDLQVVGVHRRRRLCLQSFFPSPVFLFCCRSVVLDLSSCLFPCNLACLCFSGVPDGSRPICPLGLIKINIILF